MNPEVESHRRHPDYKAYYHANRALNPRLPPPLPPLASKPTFDFEHGTAAGMQRYLVFYITYVCFRLYVALCWLSCASCVTLLSLQVILAGNLWSLTDLVTSPCSLALRYHAVLCSYL